MKKVFLAAAIMATLASGNAMAETITINGEVIENGCDVGNNGSADITLDKITVPQVKAAAIGSHLGNKLDNFKLSNCPAYDINVQFIADAVPTNATAIVNTEKPSNTVIAHYLYNSSNNQALNGTTQVLDAASQEAIAAQSAAGYLFPVNVGYTKIAEVDDDASPAGITKSIVTLNITYS